MRMARFAVFLFLAACDSDDTNPMQQADAASGPMCTGAVYDTCTADAQCSSQQCHLYSANALQVCTQACSAAVPCPPDSTGAPVTCNQMGNCKPGVANSCHR